MKRIVCIMTCISIGVFGIQAQEGKKNQRFKKGKKELIQQVADTVTQKDSIQVAGPIKEGDFCNFTKEDEVRAMSRGEIVMGQDKINQLRAFVARDRNVVLRAVFVIKANDGYNTGIYYVCAGGVVYKYYHRGREGYSRY